MAPDPGTREVREAWIQKDGASSTVSTKPTATRFAETAALTGVMMYTELCNDRSGMIHQLLVLIVSYSYDNCYDVL